MSSIFNGNNECSLTSISANGAHLKETLRNHNHQLTPTTDLIVTAAATTQVTASLTTYATTVTTTTSLATTNLESLPTSANQNIRMGLLNNNSVKDAMTHKVLLIKPNSKTDKADQINLVSLSLTPSINSLSFVNNCSLTDTRNGNSSVELSNDLVPLQKDLTRIIATTSTGTLSTSVTTTPSFVSPPFQARNLSLTSVPSIISSLQSSLNLPSLQTSDTLVTPDTMLTTKMNQLNDCKKEKRSTNSSTKMELTKSEKTVLSRDVYNTCIVEKTSVVVDNSYLTQQLLLEKQAKNILDRIKEIQAKQIDMHLNKQLKAFLKYEQIRNNIDCQYETRKTDERSFSSNSGNINNSINNSNINSNLCSYIVKTPTAEEQMKLLSPEDVKNLSTAALVNLVKSLNSAVDQHQSIASTISPPSLPSSSSLSSLSSSVQPLSLQHHHHHHQNFTTVSDKDETEKSKIKNENFKSDNSNITSGFNQQTDEIKNEMLTSCAILKNNLKHFECTYDSDATESSSGGESCDEENDCSNGKQGHTSGSNISIPIDKRAFWKWSVERAAIASRWTWLQAQVADLEFKIRQQNEMYRTLRTNKGTITFSATNLNPREHAHTSQTSLPTSSSSSSLYSSSSNLPAGATTSTAETNNIVTDQSSEGDIPNCVRTLPLKQMRKRKLVRSMNALAGATRKIARYSTVQCKCNSLPYFVSPCVLCNGRYGYIQVIDTDCMPYYERVALLDSSCHSVLSLPNDVSLGLHFSKILKREKSQQVTSRQQYKKKENFSVESQYHFNTDSKKGKKTQIVLPSSKCKKKIDGNIKRKHAKSTSEEQSFNKRSTGKGKELENANGSGDSKYDSPVASPYAGDVNSSAPLSRRRRSEQHAYDINNIVIPYSIASTTRVEKLEYKEIITPKWRVIDFNDEKSIRASESLENKLEQQSPIIEEISTPAASSDKEITDSTANSVLTTEENEDLSDEVFAIRHQKCEIDERKRFGSILNKTKTNPKGPGRGRWSRTRLDSNRSDTATSSINNGPSGDSINNIDSSSQDSFASTQEIKSKETNCEIIHGTPARTSDRHRTSSSSKRDDSIEEEHYVEVMPFEKRIFPLPDTVYEELLKTSKLEEEEEEKKEEQRRVQQESNDEIVTPTETSNKISIVKEAPKSPENIAESSIPASPNESDCSSSVADNDVDIDDMSADPEWEPKKV